MHILLDSGLSGFTSVLSDFITILGTLWTFMTGNWAILAIIVAAVALPILAGFIHTVRGG